MNQGRGESSRTHRLCAATTSESSRRRLVLERQRLINPIKEQSQWERSRGGEKSERDSQSAVEEKGEKCVCVWCVFEEGVSATAGASEAEEHTFPKEPILANGSQCIRQHPCSYVIDWLRWKWAWSVPVSWQKGLRLGEGGFTNPPTLGEFSHSFGTCPEDFFLYWRKGEQRSRAQDEVSVSLQSCQC